MPHFTGRWCCALPQPRVNHSQRPGHQVKADDNGHSDPQQQARSNKETVRGLHLQNLFFAHGKREQEYCRYTFSCAYFSCPSKQKQVWKGYQVQQIGVGCRTSELDQTHDISLTFHTNLARRFMLGGFFPCGQKS